MRTINLIASLFLVLLVPAVGFAHDGHGVFAGHELAHYLTSPAHVLPVLAGLAAGVFLLYRRYRRRASE